ncbi:hypothetical protein CRG98_031970, partial [Punica granatum]
MAEGDRVDVSEEVNPLVPTLSQPLQTHAPPPLTPAGILPVYSGALPTHLPPSASSGAPLPPVSPTSAATNDQARIAALEGTVNQMATNMAELLALLRGPNRDSSSSTPSPGQGPTTEPTPWIPPTRAPEDTEAPPPLTLHASMAHPVTGPYPPPPASTAVPLPPATFLSSEHILSAPPPVSIPAPAMAYVIPPPMVSSALSAPFKISEFKTYEGTTDLRHHLRHYRGKMLQYWEYEEFVIHSFQDSLSGSALDWFMSLKAEDIPTWEDLSRKFTDQCRYCVEAPPTLLELSTKEMARGQKFEEHFNIGLKPLPNQSTIPHYRLHPHLRRRRLSSTIMPLLRPKPLNTNLQFLGLLSRHYESRPRKYIPAEAAVGFTGIDAPPAPLVIDIPDREPYSNDKVPWTYEEGVRSLEQQFGVMGITRSGRLYKNPATTDKGKAPDTEEETRPRTLPTPSKKALMRVPTAAQVPKGTPTDRIEETINSIFSKTISFSDDELPPEGCAHFRALHIVCKCNNHIVGRVMIDNGSALNVCP